MGFSSFPVNCPLNQSIEPKKATRVRNCWACWACWLWLFGTIESQWNRMGGTRRIETSGDMTRFTSHKIDYDYIWLLANRWGQMAHQSQTNFGIILCPITLQPMTGARSIRLLPRGEIARGRQKEWTWRPWKSGSGAWMWTKNPVSPAVFPLWWFQPIPCVCLTMLF